MIYSSEKAFRLYIHYIALKRHFTSSYDYLKYNGKVNVTQASYEKRNDKAFFFRLSKLNGCKSRVLAHLIQDPNSYIQDILNDEETYYSWKRRNNSLLRTIEIDLGKFSEETSELFKVYKGDHPKILKEYMAGNISPETLSCINKATKIFSYWDSKISDTIIYPDIIFKLKKYESFLNIDSKKVKNILTSRL